MLRIRAFQGLRPPPERVAEVACVPYDVVNRDESAALAEGKPDSLLHVDRAEIDLPPETDPYSAEVYAHAKQNFRRLQDNGALIRETKPCLYLYRQRMGDHEQTGLAALCHIEDYENDLIKKHEKTRPEKEDDRTRLIDTISANTGPVFLTFRDTPAVSELTRTATKEDPLYQFTAPDGIEHTVWRIENSDPITQAMAQLPAAYVADGHHRTASAARVGRERRAKNTDHTGDEDYNWFLAVLFPASELQILAYNRVVNDLNGQSLESFLTEVRKSFTAETTTQTTPDHPHQICMYLAGAWHLLIAPGPRTDGPVSGLDVSLLQDRLLSPILGIDDPRTSERIKFIGGIRGTDELERLVDSGQAAVAFSMFPTTVEQLMAIADAGEIMPPKSTWFEPKLRSGLFIHTF